MAKSNKIMSKDEVLKVLAGILAKNSDSCHKRNENSCHPVRRRSGRDAEART